MKKILNTQPLREWFGYTRRERRSALILLVLILVIILARYVVPEKNIEVISAGSGYFDSLRLIEFSDAALPPENASIDFDPDSGSYDTSIKTGSDSTEAKAVISHRNKWGKFRKPSGIKRVYRIDSTKSEEHITHTTIARQFPEERESHPAGQNKSRLDLNKCDSASLVSLPGIGPVLSVRIIKYRNLLGGFARVEQLREVYGLPAETYELIKTRVFTDSSAVRKIKINSSDYKGLSRIPYIEKYELTAILKYRELKGRINSIEDLNDNKILAPEKGKKVRAYVDFE